ncbi:ATPase [Cohnella kolymensis]|uniref:ATPase n=1 Tax=Cohnella kolymensis TaxID=1590652 RepID=A0ABR5A3I7_9BACL|nr:SRPBCC domain-containing protein [Cohnella kolymensis]KIL35110.1 ATPase [Cohnella kolymensis]KIL36519.1 ATPase [Cohnella kolymensis]
MRTLHKEIVVSESKELIWYAWTISERVSQWFAPAANIDPRVGGAFELFFIPGNKEQMNTKGCKITSLSPMEQLSFTWKGPDDFAGLMNSSDSLTEVQVRFTQAGDKTTNVTIEHTGWGTGEQWDKAFQWHEMAWTQVLNSLKTALESGEGELCCSPGQSAS